MRTLPAAAAAAAADCAAAISELVRGIPDTNGWSLIAIVMLLETNQDRLLANLGHRRGGACFPLCLILAFWGR